MVLLVFVNVSHLVHQCTVFPILDPVLVKQLPTLSLLLNQGQHTKELFFCCDEVTVMAPIVYMWNLSTAILAARSCTEVRANLNSLQFMLADLSGCVPHAHSRKQDQRGSVLH